MKNLIIKKYHQRHCDPTLRKYTYVFTSRDERSSMEVAFLSKDSAKVRMDLFLGEKLKLFI